MVLEIIVAFVVFAALSVAVEAFDGFDTPTKPVIASFADARGVFALR